MRICHGLCSVSSAPPLLTGEVRRELCKADVVILMSWACTLPAVVLKAFRSGVVLVLAFTGDEASCERPKGSGEESPCDINEGMVSYLPMKRSQKAKYEM